jgi:hypothetical protein
VYNYGWNPPKAHLSVPEPGNKPICGRVSSL